jgi:hypothetical protein
MMVTVKLYGTLRRLSNPGTPGFWQGEIPDDSRLIDLIGILGSGANEVAGASIDGELISMETTITPGAVIILVTPIGGGCWQ